MFWAARVNYVMFSLIWSLAPILVSLTAFFTYVIQGNKLTVGTAFTVRLVPFLLHRGVAC